MKKYFYEDGNYHLRLGKHTYSISEEVSVMVDLKHKFVLHHGTPEDIQLRFESLEKRCNELPVAKQEFEDYIFVFTKSDWDLLELNNIVKDCKKIPFWMKTKIIAKKAMGKI